MCKIYQSTKSLAASQKNPDFSLIPTHVIYRADFQNTTAEKTRKTAGSLNINNKLSPKRPSQLKGSKNKKCLLTPLKKIKKTTNIH